MSMSTTSASALTRASKRLKELGQDAISIPTTQELADRKSSELDAARAKLDAIVRQQLAIKSKKDQRPPASLLAEKTAALVEIFAK